MAERHIRDFFPITGHIVKPRPMQLRVLDAIEAAFEKGKRNVLLEAPVGSGKSAMAVAAAKYFGSAHVLTPRKSLQDQYANDFKEEGMALMKGRSGYPCLYQPARFGKDDYLYKETVKLIELGRSVQPIRGARDCAGGYCKDNTTIYSQCVGLERTVEPGQIKYTTKQPCPYNVAIEVAQESDIVIHNLHSFIYQSSFAERFEQRKLMIIDECHDVEGIIRGFSELKVVIPKRFAAAEIPTATCKTLADWAAWFRGFQDHFSDAKSINPKPGEQSEQETFLALVVKVESFSEQFADQFSASWEHHPAKHETKFTFTPRDVSNLCRNYLMNFGEKRLLMSGTIYNKAMYCKATGLDPDETEFIKVGSTFPLDSRPIFFVDKYKVDTSFQKWDENFGEMIAKIKTLMNNFDDVKGLIHTPSYMASEQIYNALKDTKRVVKHDKDNFHEKLTEFFADRGNSVFLSPICQQGVDFKHDRARFQVILRVPNLNTSDPFINFQVKNNFAWYNYQSLIIFGQQIGRINRAEDDWGVTVLMDSRFEKFLQKNKAVLPKWLMDAIQYEIPEDVQQT